MVIWVTGLSGSGKTTLCKALWKLLKPQLPELVLFDGDVIRAVFGNDLGYREEDRVVQIKRLQNIARVLVEQNMVVLVAALYSNPVLLDWNRKNLGRDFEGYLKASMNTLRARDVKGLYSQAANAKTSDIVGLDIPWHAPVSPDLVIDADNPEIPAVLARRVVAVVPWLPRTLKRD